MNVSNLMQFLGYTSIYAPFDDFLITNGIKKRPSLKANGTVIYLKNFGLTLGFDFDPKGSEIDQKNEGIFVFKSIACHIIDAKEGEGIYFGELPFNLVRGDTRESTKEKLGLPTRVFDHNADGYFINNHSVVTLFNDIDGRLKLIRISLPSKTTRELGITP